MRFPDKPKSDKSDVTVRGAYNTASKAAALPGVW